MIDWFKENLWILLFYSVIVLIIYLNRSKFEIQAKIIAIYRAKWGLNFMDYIAESKREWVKLFGYIGVGIGFIGMIFIFVMLIYTLFNLIFSPVTTQGVSLVIPGVKMPNSIYIPFVYGILSIFIIATMHELSHGIVARAWRIPILSSGIVFFGPIIGAFVEPDENRMRKKLEIEQYSVFAAGPFINIVFAVFILLLLLFATPFINTYLYDGVTIISVEKDSPAKTYGLKTDSTIIKVNGYDIKNVNDLSEKLLNLRKDDNIKFTLLENGKIIDKELVAGQNGDKAYLGISFQNKLKERIGFSYYFSQFFKWFLGLLSWLMNLSLAIGLINLLPLGPTDGGRMIYLACKSIYKEKADRIFGHISFISLMLLLGCLLLSYAKPLLI